MTKKEIAISFLKMAGTGHVREAYAQFIAADFIHHNQYFKGDRHSLMDAMTEAHQLRPNREIDIKHVYNDGDTVITHSLVIPKDPEAQSIAVVHVFRFKNDRVVELWDLGQAIARHPINENGLF